MAKRNPPRGAGARTLKLLQCIASGELEFSLKHIAQQSALAPSTVHRLLAAWVDADLLERTGPKAYRLGPELFRIAALLLQRFEVRRIARPFLQRLWREWQETTSLCLYKPASHTALIAESIPTPHPLQLVFEPFGEISLPWGSMGRSILAYLPPEALQAVLAACRRSPITHRALPPRRKLEGQLATIRERGYAIYEDDALDIAGISAPVFGPSGAITGCIGVTMPDTRFRRISSSKLAAAVLSNAQALSLGLGYRAGERAGDAAGGHRRAGTYL
jgi:DNA-binding IclR family transcriptional regulator